MKLYSSTMQHIMKEVQRADPGEASVRKVVTHYDKAMIAPWKTFSQVPMYAWIIN